MDTVNWEQWWLPAAYQSAEGDLGESEFLNEMEVDLLAVPVEEEQIDDILSEVGKVLDTEHGDVESMSTEYFAFVLSPDCSTCAGTVFDVVNNRYSLSNDDEYGDRTAYYMTGALFGCQVTLCFIEYPLRFHLQFICSTFGVTA